MAIAKVQRLMQQFADSTWKTDSAARGGFQELMAAPQEVPEALLVLGGKKVVVRRPAVVDHHAGIVQAEHTFSNGARARRVNDVGGRVGADQAVQPGVFAADMPAGFIEHGPGRFLDGFTDARVDWLATPRRAQDDMGAAAAR